jgi:hypothetical protein
MINPFAKKPCKPNKDKPIARPYKVMYVNIKSENVNDENSNCLNLPNKVISLSKKIKREIEPAAPTKQVLRQVHFKQRQRPESKSFDCYLESDLKMGPLATLLIAHRMDNDCESDGEQVEAGVKKMRLSLQERIRNGEPSSN